MKGASFVQCFGLLVLLAVRNARADQPLILIPVPTPPDGPSVDGTNFIWRANVGTNYYGLPLCLVASTNASLTMTNWTPLVTNYVDITGHITFTNAITADRPVRFYRAAIVF